MIINISSSDSLSIIDKLYHGRDEPEHIYITDRFFYGKDEPEHVSLLDILSKVVNIHLPLSEYRCWNEVTKQWDICETPYI